MQGPFTWLSDVWMYKTEIASVLKTPAQQKEVGVKQEIQSIAIILKFIQELVGEKKGVYVVV